MYPADNVSVPTQLTLDRSIDPIAYSVFPMEAPVRHTHSHTHTHTLTHSQTQISTVVCTIEKVTGRDYG